VPLKAPFRLPPGFLAAFGHPVGRRWVALHWERCGDEAGYDDGVSSACGLSNNWLYLDFVHRPDVSRWLEENSVHLGNSEEPARHWLVVDSATGELYAAPRRQAHATVFAQELLGGPGDGSATDQGSSLP
jgi:hypothetical protein